MKLTTEQQNVIDAVKDHDRILVNALAGTGKTTTLVEIAKVYKGKKILILAFNRLAAEEIRNRIKWQDTQGIDVYTFHSLASTELGIRPKDGLLRDFVYQTGTEFKEAVYTAIRRFCESDLDIEELTPEKLRELVYFRKDDSLAVIVEEQQQDDISEFYSKLTYEVKRIYREAIKDCLSDHDLYLKYFAEAGSLKDYDIVLVDEAQDLNPVQHKICSKAKKIVYIGDRNQTIYSWRGAVDLDEIERDIELYLTVAFRFSSPAIVDKANAILELLKSSKKIQQAAQPKPPNGERAVITRTNVQLVEEARRLGSVRFKKPVEELLKPFKWAQGFLDLYFRSYTTLSIPFWIKKLAENLKRHKKGNFVEVLAFYNLSLASTVNFMIKNHLTVRNIRKILETAQTKDKKAPIVATVHSVKGLEYEEVRLTTDFYNLSDLKNDLKTKEVDDLTEIRKVREELNLVYVATTRAMKKLEVPLSLENLYNYGKTYAFSEEKKEDELMVKDKEDRKIFVSNQEEPENCCHNSDKLSEENTKTVVEIAKSLEAKLEEGKVMESIIDEHYEKFCSQYKSFREDCLNLEKFFKQAEIRVDDIESYLNNLIESEIVNPKLRKDTRYINGFLLCFAKVIKNNYSQFSDSYLWYKIDSLLNWLVQRDLYEKIGFIRKFYDYKKEKWKTTSEITLLEGIWCISAGILPKAYVFIYLSKYLPQLRKIAKSKYTKVTNLVCKKCLFYFPESFAIESFSTTTPKFSKEEAKSILRFLETFLGEKEEIDFTYW